LALIKGISDDSLNDFYKGTMAERKRCIYLIGKFISGEIESQWKLRDAIEERE
jgi:hypothetical protein